MADFWEWMTGLAAITSLSASARWAVNRVTIQARKWKSARRSGSIADDDTTLSDFEL